MSALAPLLAMLAVWAQPHYASLRESMVRSDIEARGVKNPRVLAALRSTERHLFVPVSLRSSAYADHPLPIGHGQTISQPYIVALMTELLDVSAEHRVLEIGTGSGYQAAVLAPLAREVLSIEIVGPLAAEASAVIGNLGLKNITIRHGDGYKGWPEKAPFDRIIVTAAPPEIPPVLIEQLKAGGKMVVPVGPQGQAQELLLIEKSADGKIRRRSTIPVLFVPMVKSK